MNNNWPQHFSPRLTGFRIGSSALSSFVIALEAWRRGLKVTFTAPELHLFRISDGAKEIEFNFSRPESLTPRKDYLRLDRKSETSQLLRESGIPVPESTLLEGNRIQASHIRSEVERIGFPVVLKPNSGSMGRGVFTGIDNWDELWKVVDHLTVVRGEKSLLLEKHHVGDDYRILVVADQVVGAVKRIPASVLGNGRSTVSELIERKNFLRKRNPFLSAGLIKVDIEVQNCLEDAGLSLNSVIPKDQRVFLRRVANASAGGDVVDVTDTIPTSMKTAALKAVRALPNIVIAGVDILFNDSGTTQTDKFVIIEINSRPQIGVNMYPTVGQGRDAAEAILSELFPGSFRSEDSNYQTIKFDEKLVKSLFASGSVGEITLPAFPDSGLPARRRFEFSDEGATVSLRPFSGQILRKLARTRGISGVLRHTKNGTVELVLAGKTMSDLRALSDRVAMYMDASRTTEEDWTGIVTVGFSIQY